eukprot:4733047-Prymnesium_polylepis.2
MHAQDVECGAAWNVSECNTPSECSVSAHEAACVRMRRSRMLTEDNAQFSTRRYINAIECDNNVTVYECINVQMHYNAIPPKNATSR